MMISHAHISQVFNQNLVDLWILNVIINVVYFANVDTHYPF